MLKATHVVLVFSVIFLTGISDLSAETSKTPSNLYELSLEELLNVEVSSVSRQDSTIGRSPAAVFVITPEMIRRSGATSIPELFRMVPGVHAVRIDGNKWAVSARGFNDRFAGKLLVQIDGRTVYTPIFSGVYWDTVDYPLEDIERIEVIRGPGASVWGANAMNGVINIITKHAEDTQGGLASAGSGSKERSFGTLRIGDKVHENLYYRVYGKGFGREEQYSPAEDSHDASHGGSTGVRLDWEADEDNALTFDIGYLHSAAGRIDTRPTSGSPFIFRNMEEEISELGHVMGQWQHQLDENSSWQLQMYWDHVQRDSTNGFLHQRGDTFDIDFQHQFPIGERQNFIYGAGYRYLRSILGTSTWDNGFALTYVWPYRRKQTFSTFVQDEILLRPDFLTLTLGSKLEHNDFTGIEAQPTARLLWTPTQRQSVWTAISRAVRTPSLSEDALAVTLLQSTPGVGNYPQVRGNPDLKSEEILAHELGYRVQVAENLSTDIAVFYNDYNDLKINVAKASEPPFAPIEPENDLAGKTYGVEWANSWQPLKNWRLTTAYTFMQIELMRAYGLPASAENAEHQTPQSQVHMQSSWDVTRNIEFDVITRYVGRLGGFNPSSIPGVQNYIPAHVTLDLRLGWQPRKDWMIDLVGQNLLDESHPEFGTSPLLRAPVVEIKRSFYLKATYHW